MSSMKRGPILFPLLSSPFLFLFSSCPIPRSCSMRSLFFLSRAFRAAIRLLICCVKHDPYLYYRYPTKSDILLVVLFHSSALFLGQGRKLLSQRSLRKATLFVMWTWWCSWWNSRNSKYVSRHQLLNFPLAWGKGSVRAGFSRLFL